MMQKFLLSLGAATMIMGSSIMGFPTIPEAMAQQASSEIFLPMVQSGEVVEQAAPSDEQTPDDDTPDDDTHDDGHSHGPGDHDDDDLVYPDLGAGKKIFDTAHFRIHYTLEGNHAIQSTDLNNNGIPEIVDYLAEALEFSRDVSLNRFGWAEPPSDGTYGGNALYDVFLEEVNGGYVSGGQDEALVGDNPNTPDVVETTSSSSYMGIAKDVLDLEDDPNDVGALANMRSLVAHEYMHSIQYGYDGLEPGSWLWESTANWMMEEIYSAENVGHDELFHAYDSPDYAFHGDNTDWYARWIFFRNLSEQHGHDVVKDIWEAALTEDGYAAMDIALHKYGVTLEQEMSGYMVALLLSDFVEDANYLTVRLEGIATDRFEPTDGVESMGADYVEIRGEGPLTVGLEATGLEGIAVGVKNGQASIHPLVDGQTTVDSDAYDHLYLVVQNLQRPTEDDATRATDYVVNVTAGGTVREPASTVAVPKFQVPVVAERQVDEGDAEEGDEDFGDASQSTWDNDDGVFDKHDLASI